MSFEAAAWAIQQTPESPVDKLVLIALADCYNKNNSRCDPSNAYLAEHALCSQRYVSESVTRLVNGGFISVVRQKGRRNNYRIHTPELSSGVPLNSDQDTPELSSETPELSSPEPVEPIIKPEYLHFHLFMIEKILQVHSGFKQPNANTWCKDIRLMVERDNRQLQDMGRVFTWANNDEFWCGNILSPAKLRKQYDKLVIQMKDSPRPKKANYWDMDDGELVRLCANAGFRTQGKSKKELVSKLESAA